MSKLSPIESSQQLWDLLDELEVVCFSNRTESLELSFPWINVPSMRKGSVRDSKIMFCHDMMVRFSFVHCSRMFIYWF